MKIRTTKYIIKEGISNASRNKLMSLASLTIITASLIVLGIFYIVSININANLKTLQDQPEIQIYCLPELDDNQITQVEKTIKDDKRIENYRVVSKKEALEKASKILLEDNKDLLEGIDESFMSVSFIVKLKEPKTNKEVTGSYKAMTNLVQKVVSPQEAIDFISMVTSFVPIVSGFLFVVLVTISIFIISNTIRLTVFARRREINIMKFIGATDWFIRWPFIVEGLIIGFVGALAAFILVGIGYNVILGKANTDLLKSGVLKLVSLSTIKTQIIIVYMLVGALVGAIGSMISIRKHLHV